MGLGKSESAENQQIHVALAFAGEDPLLAFLKEKPTAWVLAAHISIHIENHIFSLKLQFRIPHRRATNRDARET